MKMLQSSNFITTAVKPSQHSYFGNRAAYRHHVSVSWRTANEPAEIEY